MLRAERRRKLGRVAGEEAREFGKPLMVAPDQVQARRYLEHIRAKLPQRRRMIDARLAVSDERDAAETLAAFRLLPEPAILVTVAMAYEGLDALSVAVVASLTHICSRPWLEQMITPATRVDPDAGFPQLAGRVCGETGFLPRCYLEPHCHSEDAQTRPRTAASRARDPGAYPTATGPSEFSRWPRSSISSARTAAGA